MRKTKKQKAQVTLAFSTTEFDYNIASPAVRFPVLIGPQLGCSVWLAAELYGIVTKGTTQLLSITQATGTEWKGAHQCGPLNGCDSACKCIQLPRFMSHLVHSAWVISFFPPGFRHIPPLLWRSARTVNVIILSFTMYFTEITKVSLANI